MPPVPTGNPAIRRVLLFAEPIAHKNYRIQLNGQLTCGPGLDSGHGTRVLPVLAHKPYPLGTAWAWQCLAVLHGMQWLDQVVTGK